MKPYPKCYLFNQLARYFKASGIKYPFSNHSNTIFIEPGQKLPALSFFFDTDLYYIHVRTWPEPGKLQFAFDASGLIENLFDKLLKFKLIDEQHFNYYRRFQEREAPLLQEQR